MLKVSPWSPAELLVPTQPVDENEWVPAAMDGVWMRPLLFNTVNGAWVNLVRMRKNGFVSRHAHPSPVHGYVISGNWRYAERDWIAKPGDYLFEPAGDVHTLMALPGERRHCSGSAAHWSSLTSTAIRSAMPMSSPGSSRQRTISSVAGWAAIT